MSLGWATNRIWLVVALGVWGIAILVVSALFVADPVARTVTHLYHDASAQWASGAALYKGPAGMNYLPHFALIFAPFHALPAPLGDLLWRLLSTALVVWGIWRVARQVWGSEVMLAFPWVLLLALPLSLAPMRYGQANGILAGLMLLGTASLMEAKWGSAAAWIALAIVVKPIALVFALVVALSYPKVRSRLFAAAVVVVLAPFAFGGVDYVLSQYSAALANLSACAGVTEHRFADFQGIVRTLGVEIASPWSLVIRVAALVAVAGAAWTTVRSMTEPTRGLWALTLTVVFLMLFNPMNESNSYAIFAPVIALWAVRFLPIPERAPLGWTLTAIVLAMGLLPEPLRPLFGNSFSLFFSPLMAIVFLVLLLRNRATA